MPRGQTPAGGVIVATPQEIHAEQLAQLLEHCVAAQTIADAQGERFLSYMLAMTIQAARDRGRR